MRALRSELASSKKQKVVCTHSNINYEPNWKMHRPYRWDLPLHTRPKVFLHLAGQTPFSNIEIPSPSPILLRTFLPARMLDFFLLRAKDVFECFVTNPPPFVHDRAKKASSLFFSFSTAQSTHYHHRPNKPCERSPPIRTLSNRIQKKVFQFFPHQSYST